MKTSEYIQKISDMLNNNLHLLKNIKLDSIKSYQKSKEKDKMANLCLRSAIYRIHEIDYDLKIENFLPQSYFELVGYIVQIDVLRSCVRILCDAFHVEINGAGTKIFDHKKEAGNDGDESSLATDDDYFNYIRSICVAHPLETTRHPKFQQSGEWSYRTSDDPYYRKGTCDFLIEIFTDQYDNGTLIDENCKDIPLYMCEFQKYIKYYFSYLPRIYQALEQYIKNVKDEFKRNPIKCPADFSNYYNYLLYLQKENTERYGGQDNYEIKEVMCLFLLQEQNQHKKKFQSFREYIKNRVEQFRVQMQNMVDEPDIIFDNIFGDTLDGYTVEKLQYLRHFPSQTTVEKIGENLNIKEIENLNLLKQYFNEPFSESSEAKIGEKCTNAEWSRILLYRDWETLNMNMKIDVFQSDWYVYWQVCVACYINQNTNN